MATTPWENEVAADRRYVGPLLSPSGHCRGGYIWHYDTDYPCSGCARCRPEALQGWSVGAFVWAQAHQDSRREVLDGLSALHWLSTIGRAIETALCPGRALYDFLHYTFQVWNRVTVGYPAEVIGSQGAAARRHRGMIGLVEGISANNDYGVTRARMLFEDGHRAFVPVGQLTRVLHVPEWAAAARMKAQADRDARMAVRLAGSDRPIAKGEMATIMRSLLPDTKNYVGQSGRVFWIDTGPTGVPRCGLKITIFNSIIGGQTEIVVWCDQAEVAPIRPTEDGDWPIMERFLSEGLEAMMSYFRFLIEHSREIGFVPRRDKYLSVRTARGWRKRKIG